MDERAVRPGGFILSHPAGALGGVEQTVQDLGIAGVTAAIAVQIVHAPIAVFIDENVGGGAKGVPAVDDVAERAIVRRSPVAAHHVECAGPIPRLVRQRQQLLEPLHEAFVQYDVLGITARLFADELLEL